MNTEILTEKDLQRAAEFLKEGELVAFPTETVYGLGASIYLEASIRKIFWVKARPSDNPLIAHVASLEDCEALSACLPLSFFDLAKAFFPGPLTLIVKKHPSMPDIVTAGLDTIAIRMPSHPVAQKLIEAAGSALVAPSANISGSPSATSIKHVLADFEGKIAAVIDGGIAKFGIESTVLDLVSFDCPTILRPGHVTKQMLQELLRCEVANYSRFKNSRQSSQIRSPGMKYRHYCPKALVKLFSDRKALEKHFAQNPNSLILSDTLIPMKHLPLEAKTLYAHLRLADEKGYNEVVIFYGLRNDEALLNRLERMTDESNCY